MFLIKLKKKNNFPPFSSTVKQPYSVKMSISEIIINFICENTTWKNIKKYQYVSENIRGMVFETNCHAICSNKMYRLWLTRSLHPSIDYTVFPSWFDFSYTCYIDIIHYI